MGVRDIKHLKKLSKPLLWSLLVSEFLLAIIFADFAYKGLSIDFGVLGIVCTVLCSIVSLGFLMHSLLVALFIMKVFIKGPA